MAFNERFAPVFFGRDPEIAAVLDKLNGMRHRGEPRMLLIHGGSGSGKSSLLKAGVLPRLARNRDWLVLPTLRYGETPNDDETLFARLAKELTVRFPSDSPTRPDWKDLRAKFESDDVEAATQCFIDVTQNLTMALGCHEATTLLTLDQFEELLTSSVRPSADKFLKFLRVLLSRNNGQLLAIATLRSDYLDVYERHPHALQPPYLLTDRLPPFPWERVTDVIVQPAARVGVTFTNELLERLKLDAPTSDALPLLAFTLEKLFRECATDKHIALAEYESLGGTTGAIEQAVKKIVPSKLPPETEQALRLSFVRHLVQVNEKDEFVRRPAHWSDLPVAAQPLIEDFVKARLLQISDDDEAATVEVSHEAIFRCWDQLKAWLHAELNNLRLRRKLEVTAKEWNGSVTTERPNGDEDLCFTLGQLEAIDDWKQQVKLADIEQHFLKASRNKRNSDTQREIERLQQLADAERKKQHAEAQRASDAIRFSRRLKWALVGTTAVALVAIVLGVVTWRLRVKAEQQTQVAEARRLQALAQLAGETLPERSLLLAVAAIETSKRAGTAGFPEVESYLREQLHEVGGRRYALAPATTGDDNVEAFSDGNRFMMAASLNQNDMVRLWNDSFDGSKHSTQEHPFSKVRRLSLSPDASLIAIVSGSSVPEEFETTVWTTHSFDDTDAEPVCKLPESQYVNFSTGNRFLMTSEFSVPPIKLAVWPLQNSGPSSPITSLELGDQPVVWSWFDERERVLVCATSSTIHEWDFDPVDPENWHVKTEFSAELLVDRNQGYGRQPLSFAYCRSYSRTKIAVGWSDGNIELWQLAFNSSRPTVTLRVHTSSVKSLAVNPSGTLLASGSNDHRIVVWGLEALNPLADCAILRGLERAVLHVSFPDDKTVIGHGPDGTVRVWDEFPFIDRCAIDQADHPSVIEQRRQQIADELRVMNGKELCDRAARIAGRSLSDNEIAELDPSLGRTDEQDPAVSD